MEPISETQWDLLIEGTGLAGSLLALSLSRSGKKILHLDVERNYGGTESSLSLEDAETWSLGPGLTGVFREARVTRYHRAAAELGFPRAYSLGLAPQITYTRSALLPTLVSSKIYRQLEFLAVGSWFIYEKSAESEDGQLSKIPAGREDVFADRSIDLKAKRSLIKFLRLVADPEAQAQAIADIGAASLGRYLLEQYRLPEKFQNALCALTLSPAAVSDTPASWALPRIGRHLASIGVFGPGFGSVIPKWGGLSEVAQVACRAAAVGGATYMLGHAVHKEDGTGSRRHVTLTRDDTASTDWLVTTEEKGDDIAARSATVVASTLPTVFPLLGDGAPPPAAAVVVFPPHSIHVLPEHDLPVYLFVHSSDTGECPTGQCVIYASTYQSSKPAQLEATPHLKDQPVLCGHELLRAAVSSFLCSVDETPEAVLWELQYTQRGMSVFAADRNEDVAHPMPHDGEAAAPSRPEGTNTVVQLDDRRVRFQPMSLDLAFDDGVLRDVRRAWMSITGESEGFMTFEDREVGAYDDDE